MLELAINSEASGSTDGPTDNETPTLTHFYAVAMNASENGTSAISAGKLHNNM